MDYQTAREHITAQLGDPEGRQLDDRAATHLIAAFSTLMKSEGFTPMDAHGYWKVANIAFDDSATEDISGLSVLRILEMFPNPLATSSDNIYGYSVSFLGTRDISLVTTNTGFSPSDEDFFVYRIGDTLYPLSNLTYPLTANDRLRMEYVEYPDNTDWVDTTELEDYFTIPFIYQAIDRAVQTLGQEDQAV